jgi:hypothetical protein
MELAEVDLRCILSKSSSEGVWPVQLARLWPGAGDLARVISSRGEDGSCCSGMKAPNRTTGAKRREEEVRLTLICKQHPVIKPVFLASLAISNCRFKDAFVSAHMIAIVTHGSSPEQSNRTSAA